MGLDCSHNAYCGGYTSFNRLRRAVAEAIGGSYPPHYVYDDAGNPMDAGEEDRSKGCLIARKPGFDEKFVYYGEGFSARSHPGLSEFLEHSDCGGEISPEMCLKVADDLESILPCVAALGWTAYGHLAEYGYVGTLQRFIAGCRAAHEANEPLLFH